MYFAYKKYSFLSYITFMVWLSIHFQYVINVANK